MEKLKGRKPDLVGYFSNSPKYTKSTKTALEPFSEIQTAYSDVFSDPNLTNKIGSRSHTTTIYDVKNPINIKKNLFKQLNSSSIYFPQGTLNVSTTYDLQKNNQGIYSAPSGTYVNTINSGSGKFLGCKGYLVSIINSKTLISENLVYFDK